MSKSNPNLENPCKKFIEFKADEGKFIYYNKETEKQVEVPLPIYFCVLDELSTVKGFNKKHESSIYSNEVHSINNEILRVRTFKGGESVTGFYKDIRDSIVAMGGKFTKSVYSLLIHNDLSYEFVNFQFKGAAFSAWLEKKINTDKFIVGITEFVEEKNGNNTYQVPIFKAYKMSPEIDAAAIEQDKILQEYLKVYKAKQPEVDIAKAEAVNELTEKSKEEFVANPNWAKESRSDRMERAKAAMEPSTPPKGKQFVKAMSSPDELPGANDDNPDNLPF